MVCVIRKVHAHVFVCVCVCVCVQGLGADTSAGLRDNVLLMCCSCVANVLLMCAGVGG